MRSHSVKMVSQSYLIWYNVWELGLVLKLQFEFFFFFYSPFQKRSYKRFSQTVSTYVAHSHTKLRKYWHFERNDDNDVWWRWILVLTRTHHYQWATHSSRWILPQTSLGQFMKRAVGWSDWRRDRVGQVGWEGIHPSPTYNFTRPAVIIQRGDKRVSEWVPCSCPGPAPLWCGWWYGTGSYPGVPVWQYVRLVALHVESVLGASSFMFRWCEYINNTLRLSCHRYMTMRLLALSEWFWFPKFSLKGRFRYEGRGGKDLFWAWACGTYRTGEMTQMMCHVCI